MSKKENDNVDEPFYEVIFQAREDSGSLIIDEETWTEYNDIKKEHKKTLYEFISKRVHPKTQKKLKQLIENVLDAMDDCEDFENQQYYFSGIKDSLELFTFLFADKINKK